MVLRRLLGELRVVVVVRMDWEVAVVVRSDEVGMKKSQPQIQLFEFLHEEKGIGACLEQIGRAHV